MGGQRGWMDDQKTLCLRCLLLVEAEKVTALKNIRQKTLPNKKELHYFQKQNSAHLSISWVEVL